MSSLNLQMHSVSFPYGAETVTLETGHIARQATGAVMARMGETAVLVTVVGRKEAKTDIDFFPLTVNYQERFYAGGRIPGGFFKREGRPTERETLVSRLIDRPLRPIFPKGFYNEVQVVATVMSLDPQIDSAIPALLGAAAALAISGLPAQAIVAGARVGFIDNQLVLNPTARQMADSQLDLVLAGTPDAILMVESDAQQLSEETMLEAVLFGHAQLQTAINAIQDLVNKAGKARWEWNAPVENADLQMAVAAQAQTGLDAALSLTEKAARREAVAAVRASTLAALTGEGVEIGFEVKAVETQFNKLEKKTMRGRVLSGQPRLDGRDTRTVRPIEISTKLLPRVHGSALFTRGETQTIAVATLGTMRDSQIIDAIEGETKDMFMLHYNFPPYCTGETGMVGSPKRREIGHGRLARRAVEAVLPKLGTEAFPYTLRVVSEVTESNGSSSMATVCGASLALMDAGVPLQAPVAGVAMGLIKDGDLFAVLTDILGDEDHLGDMDFKVAGTANGITALQMDIKIAGITREILVQALAQAKEGRLHILGEMAKVISAPSAEMSAHAPRVTTMKIPTDKIRDVIGKGGATIRSITEETGTTIDIDDDGTLRISATSQTAADAAIARVESITRDIEVDKVYEGKVVKILDFGAFVNIAPGKDGLLHISQLADRRVERVDEIVKEGDIVKVRVLEVDRQGKIRLSIRAV